MPRVARLSTYPIKSLSPQDRQRAVVTQAGTLAGDRELVLVGPDGDLVNGKRTERVHDLETSLDGSAVTVDPVDGEPRTFDLEHDWTAAEDWFTDFFDLEVTLERDGAGRPDRTGTVSVVSTATLAAVADWFESVTVDGLRRRLRANVEVAGVDPFWEDRFVGADAPTILVGGGGGDEEEVDNRDAGDRDEEGKGGSGGDGVRLEGVEHCVRCVVPTRDPDTGEPTPDFRETFVRRRREQYPDWVDPDEQTTDYTLMLIAAVPEADRGGTLAVDQPVRVVA